MNSITDFLKELLPKEIIHSKRRTIAITLNDKGELLARAPIRCEDRRVLDFIYSKRNWILTKRAEIRKNSFHKLNFDGSAETIPILGQLKTIILTKSDFVEMKEDIIFVPTINAKEKLVQYLKNLCKVELNFRVKEIAQALGYSYKSVSVRDSKTRWGSCGYNNSLNFSYRLILCPDFVVYYIIVHELTHTFEKNHSHKFWERVQAVLPNYKTAELWLKTNKSIMNLI